MDMDSASRQANPGRASRTKAPGTDIVLLTDELELAMGRIKADAAGRKAFKAMASPGGRSPLRRSFTDGEPEFRLPGFMTPTRGKMAGANTGVATVATDTAGLPGGRTGAVPRSSTEGEPAESRGGAGAASAVPVPMTRRKSAGNGEDDRSTGASEVPPGSPFSPQGSSSEALGRYYSATATDGAQLARLKHFDISAFSLASAPGSPQVFHAAPPAEDLAELPPLPGSPDHVQGSCFTFVMPKQVDGSVLSPLGWLVSLLCSYQSPVRERLQHLHVVRHAQRRDAADPLWRDSADRPWDPPLSERGKEEAYLVGARLRRESPGPHRVVCSPYLRCVETAAELVKALMASDSEVERRVAAAAAKAGGAPGVPDGGQAVDQMVQHKGASNGLQNVCETDAEAEAESEGGAEARAEAGAEAGAGIEAGAGAGAGGWGSGEGDARRGRRSRGSRKVRAYIDPGLCEIRTPTATATATATGRGDGVPGAHPSSTGGVLLPREELEALLPLAALRPGGGALPPFEAPRGPAGEDVDQGLHRLLGAGDRICEQYASDNIVLVTHSEAIHGSILRCLNKAIVYNIQPAGYVHLERTVYEDAEDEEDRGVSPGKLVTKSGTTGVSFTS